MTDKGREFCLIVEGAYLTESEAEHALRDPFIEDWVEQHGNFKIHNMDDIQVTPGVKLGSLGVVMIDDRVFEIASVDPDHPLTEHKAKGVAESLFVVASEVVADMICLMCVERENDTPTSTCVKTHDERHSLTESFSRRSSERICFTQKRC